MVMANEQHQAVQSLIASLAEYSQNVDKDDLVRLAKMHGFAEALATATGPESYEPVPAIYERLPVVARTLESLILGEVDDAAQAVASLVEAITALSGGETSDATEPNPPRMASDADDDEVAAKLALVFDEGSPPEEPGAPDNTVKDESDRRCDPPDQDQGQIEPEDAASAVEEQSPADSSAVGNEPPYEPEPLRIEEKEAEFVSAFLEEANEHIEAVEAALLEVERALDDSEKIDTLFRPFHTIKGMAGFLNLRDIGSLTHEVETLLDQARRGNRAITPALIDLVFDVVDILKVQIAAIGSWLANPTGEAIPRRLGSCAFPSRPPERLLQSCWLE